MVPVPEVRNHISGTALTVRFFSFSGSGTSSVTKESGKRIGLRTPAGLLERRRRRLSWCLRLVVATPQRRRRLSSSRRSAASCPLTPPLLFASCSPPLPFASCLPAGCRDALVSRRRRLRRATLPPLLRHLHILQKCTRLLTRGSQEHGNNLRTSHPTPCKS